LKLDDADSETLYAACLNQDIARRTAAYEALWRYLFRVALQVVNRQPDAHALAEDCAQRALLRVHNRIDECREPGAFRAWARRIAGNLAIDELRRRKRLDFSVDDDHQPDPTPYTLPPDRPLEQLISRRLDRQDIQSLLAVAPVSHRSRRVITGRYLEGLPDNVLAERETTLASREMRPSHIQVARTKNMSALRGWDLLREFAASLPVEQEVN
jgi:RNA polymerase sigma factor (sigma-70 family)